MRAAFAWLLLGCACSTVESSALRTTPSAPPNQGQVAVRFTQEPTDADELGIVEAHGRRPAATLQQVMAELTGRVAALGGDIARVDAFATQYEMLSESYTYDCGTTETRQEPRTATRTGPSGTMTTVTEYATVTHHEPKTCTGVRQVEGATLTIRGRAFRARRGAQ
jgi:hypothetical protein